MLEISELRKLVLEFVKVIAPVVSVYDGINEGTIDAEQTLALWMQVPDSSYSPMFLGWALAKGHDINGFTPSQLELAVQTALVGDNKNVMFDWLGDADASNKPH